MSEPRPYRGLTKGGNKWVKGWYAEESWSCEGGKVCSTIHPIDKPWHSYLVIPETVGQSIGLKDKKNKEDVYQHDIVSCSSHSTPSVLFKGVIKWRAPEFYLACFWQKVNGDEESFPVGANNRSLIRGWWVIDEILGNIHQHPELLKGAKS